MQSRFKTYFLAKPEAPENLEDVAEAVPLITLQFYRMSGLSDGNVKFFLRAMSAAVAISTNSVRQRLELANDGNTFAPNPPSRFYRFAWALLPALEKTFIKEADCLTTIAAADAALAVEAFRANNSGRIPSSLSELVPVYLSDVPIDPATEKPLTVIPASTGYAIHGAGPLFTVRR